MENAETVNQNGSGTQVTEADGTLVAVATSEIQTVTGENGYLLLSTDVTLYAKWEAANVDYTIVVWKQRTTDATGLSNEDKTWDFAEIFVQKAQPYANVIVSDAYKALDDNDNYNSVHDSGHQIGEGGTNPYTGYSLNTGTIGSGDNTRDLSDTTAQSIAYEGTTVFNLYYDWKGAAVVASDAPHTLKFMNGDEEYSRDETVTEGTKLSTKYPGTKPAGSPGYEFHWYLDSACTKQADGTTMPDHDLTLYAGWEKEWYLIQIDPNFGELAQYDNNGDLIGNGSTYFWKTYQSDYIQEYTWVTRDYIESDSGNYYFVQHDNNYNSTHSNVPNRWTYYTTNIGEATSLKTYKKSSGTYLYDGWYQVNADGTETPYTFGELITGNTTLRLHWKKAGTYYLQYNTDVTIDGQRLIGTLSDDSVQPASDGYRDEAEIIIGGRAVAPEGYAFVGWTIRSDDSGTVYYPGKTFSLQGEYAVTVNGKKTVYLDAVYQQIKTARIVYDANGGTISNSADSGYPYELNSSREPVLDEDLNLKNLNTHKVARDTNTGTVTVSGLVNNSPVKLSSGEGFTAPENSNATLTGWNTEPDGSGDHYALGAYQDESGYPICVDINDPVTLYAEWQIKVYFNKNDAEAEFSDSGWTDYTPVTDSESAHYGEYYIETYVNATLKEPIGTVTKSGASFDFWSKTADGGQANAFQFDDEKLTGERTLYAHMTEAIKVPYHVVSTNRIDRDSWRKTDTLRVTGTALDLSTDAGLSNYVTAETGYTYSYACLSDSAANISQDNKITAVKVEGGTVKVTSATDINTGAYNTIPDGKQIYLVYATENADSRVKLAYVQEGSSGALSNIVGAEEGKITYNGAEFNALNTSLVPTVLNNATVANGSIEGEIVSGQVLTLSGTPLEVSQFYFPGVFNAPPLLDDGAELLSLVYDSFGVSNEAADNVSSLVGAGKVLYLRHYDGKRQWSQDGTTWTTFTGDTLYVVYRPRGLELEITKAVTGDNTGISPEESFAVTVTSDAITRSSYPVEGTGYNTVAATPASGSTQGKIELTVKDGSDIKISGLGSGIYTVTETHNANYTLNAKIDNEDPVTADTVTVTLDQDRAVHLSNVPHEICQIMDTASGGYKKFYTLNKALEYAGTYLDGEAIIQMISDYVMPDWDVLEIPAGYAITLTKGGTDTKTITRNPELATTTAMVTNYGTLTLENIVFDGTDVSAKSSMVRNAGTLMIGSGAQFKNANRTSGNGGAVFQTQGTMTVASGASFTGNRAANGGAIYVNSGIVTITGGTFTDNTSTGNGGAIYYAGSDTVTISGGTFTDNTSTGNGGAIYASGGSLTVSGTSISSNIAGGSGGAIYSDSGTVSIYSGTVESNTAAQNGGAVYSGSGEVTLSGGTVKDNTATNGGGGAICSEAGTVTITGGTIIGSKAEAGFGGAVYVGSGTVEMSGGTIGGNGVDVANSAKNGAGIYVKTGSAMLSAGSITNNEVKLNRQDGDPLRGAALGGAVGVGSNTARLYLSGNMQITGNKAEVNDKDSDGNLTADVIKVDCNIYLDQDADDVINIAGLINADIGIYVSDSVYSQRGVPGAKFATYTTDTNKNKIKNDRDAGFSVVSESATKKLYWGNAITVVVRYQKTSFETQLPPAWTKTGDDYKSVTITNYYPVMGDDGYVAISALAENLYTSRTTELSSLGLSTSAAYGGAWLSDSNSFDDYVTKLTWDTANKKWMLTDHNGEATQELGNKQLIVYYTESAYISIENNTDMSLTISSLSLTVGATAMSVINTYTDAGYGMLFAKNGAIRTGLFPVESDDLVLEPNKAVSLLIPGGRDMSYSLGGRFETTTGGTVNLRTTKSTGSDYDSYVLTVDPSGDFDFPTGKRTLNQAGTYQIIFGDDKMICKINTTEITGVGSADYLTCTNPDTEGNVEYVFKSLKQAIEFVTKYMSASKTATIEMLTDYLLPASDNMGITADYNITVTTASSGTYKYTPAVAGENRATISRDSENKDPLIAVTSGNNNTFLTIKDLIIDGKSVQGSTKDGAVSVKNAGLTVRHSAFKNVYAGNGGAIFAECGQNQTNSWTKVYDSTFSNCHSTKTGSRDGGGAIHAYVNYMEVDGCSFDSCDADWQAGAIFHKVENNNKYTESYVTNCTFTNCRSKAAGGLELGSRNIIVMGCTFTNCVATARNGGGFNVYALKSGEPTADCWTTVIDCTFTDCHNTGTDGGRGGGFRCTSKYTTIVNTDFTNTSATIGGAVALSSKNAELVEIYGGTIDGGVATDTGGGVYSLAKTMKIGGSYTYQTDENGKPIIYNKNGARIDGKNDATTATTVNYDTTIKNCTAKNAGGGIYHENNTDKYEVTVTDTTIQNCVSTNGAGGGIRTNSRTVTVTGSRLQNNRAKGNGGGICSEFENASYRLTVDSTVISGNVSGGMGGGIYNKSQLTLRNGTRITGNRLTGNTAENAAGVYVLNSRTLTVGTAGATAADGTTVKDNTTAGGTASDVRLAPNGTNNAANSVSVLCDLSGEIRVVNPGAAGTQFGTRANADIKGFTEGQHVFVADSGGLYGVYNRNDVTKLIWRGGVICKLTDATGHLLYFDAECNDPAVFDRLDYRTDGSKLSPFSYFRQANNSVLLYRKGDSAALDLEAEGIQIKMLVSSFETDTYMTMKKSGANHSGWNITLTTASSMDTDDYPYTGRAGSYATIKRTSFTNSLILTDASLTLRNITLDGGSADKTNPRSGTEHGGLVQANTSGITVTLGANSVLQNSAISGKNGGAVNAYNGASLIIQGGAIYNCTTTGNGGGVYKAGDGKFEFTSGIISHCSATNGGGVYFETGAGGFIMSGTAQITGCTAVNEGGGVWLNEQKTMTMSGGSITGNHAGTAGGGVFIKGNNLSKKTTKLNLSGRVTVSGNTCGYPAYDCNVQLGTKDNNPTTNNQGVNDWNGVINSKGISRNSYIGIYVPGEESPGDNPVDKDTTVFDRHGIKTKPFGTYSGDTNYLYCFVNDRNGLKGGLQIGDTHNYIYWVEIFSLKVGKTVISGETSDLSEEFEFKVTFSTSEGGPAYYDFNSSNTNNCYFTYDGAYSGKTDADGNPNTISIVHGEATVYLKNGESITVDNLPAEINNGHVYYKVEEILTDSRKEHYTTTTARSTNPSDPGVLYVKGTIGENLDREDVSSKYVSNALFDNLNAICKLTSSKNGGVLLNTLDTASGNFVPAVYTTLHDESNGGAFDVVNATTPLYFWNSFTMKYEQYDYSGSDTLNVEMLVEEHTPLKPVTLNNSKAVTFTTASSTAKDGYPYVGTGSTARIIRVTTLGAENYMFTVNGALTLNNICLDGNSLSVNKGLVTVSGTGNLTVETGAILQNSKVTNSGATNGGAVFVTGGTMTMTGGTIKDNATIKYGGGAIRMESGAKVTVSGGEITGNKVQNNDANGGAISVRGGTLTISGGTIKNNTVSGNNAANEGSNKAVGGAIYVHSSASATITGGTIQGNTVKESSKAYGGAVYVDGGELTLSGGSIYGNTAAMKGGGIYLTEAATLNLSGAPAFGDGTGGKPANTVTMTGYSDKKNGNENVYGENKVRQDIYITETGDTPASIKIVGNLTGQDGSIWVWAESEKHNQTMTPFAVIDTSKVSITDENRETVAEMFKKFRNALPDDQNGNPLSQTPAYLYGVLKSGDNQYVYWYGVEGSAHVILVKVLKTGASYQALAKKPFRVYTDTGMTRPAWGKVRNSSGTEVEINLTTGLDKDGKTPDGVQPGTSPGGLISGAGGAFFIGELSYGTYYVGESGVTGYFEITIDEGGVVRITDTTTNPKTTVPVKTVNLST